MAEEIGAWLAEHELDKIDGLLDQLLAHCEEFSDLKEMEEEDVAKLVTGLGLKTMKAKKVARAFAGLGGRAPASPSPGLAAAVVAFALPDGGTVEIGEEIGRGKQNKHVFSVRRI